MNGPARHIWYLSCGLAASTVVCVALWHVQKKRYAGGNIRHQHAGGVHSKEHQEDDDIEPPDEYKDPISLSIIEDPVVLAATGQVYCFKTLKEWFKTGHRICPRTNIEILDVQVTRIPWLKHKIHQWQRDHGLSVPSMDEGPSEALLEGVHPNLSQWVKDIRHDCGQKRLKAVTDLNSLMREWEARPTNDVDELRNRSMIREVVSNDMLALLRYGDPFLQGVAASILAYATTPDEVQWLAPTAVVPAVLLCLSPNSYSSQAATRLLYNIARSGEIARRTIRVSGGVQSLLRVVQTDRDEYGYSRDRAAATLAIMAKDPEVKEYLRRHALAPLMAMLKGRDEDRWEKRDAATLLLVLQFSQEELGSDLTPKQLFEYFWCSRSWLEGHAARPCDGYSAEELQARSDLELWRANPHEAVDLLLPGDLVLEFHHQEEEVLEQQNEEQE